MGRVILFNMLAAPDKDLRLVLSEAQAEELANAYGTPLYVVDEMIFRSRIRRYLAAFRTAYPKSELSYASKANSTLAILAIAASEGCYIDVASEGEFRAALAAGVPAERCHFHGNNKLQSELEFALHRGIGVVIADNFTELERIANIGWNEPTKVILRLAPGVDPITHAKISTGQADTKFGFNIADGSAEKAVSRCLALNLPLIGFHCHVGSQLIDPEAQKSGGELIAEFAVEMLRRFDFRAQTLNVGGGLAAVYTKEDRPMSVEEYCHLVVGAIQNSLENSGLNPTLAQEPGRSLIAEAGITLYRIGVVKTVPQGDDKRTYVCVDGGLSDNPRPALYGAKYDVRCVRNGEPARLVTVSGRHCETDKMFSDVFMPSDLKEGDMIQVLSTGAYNASMASNYNRFPRPATALLRANGSHELVQRRDNWDEMLARESVPKDLA